MGYPFFLTGLDSRVIMAAMKVTKEYDRHFFEIHQQSENGKWYRMVSSDLIEDGNEKLMFKQVLDKARQQVNWSSGLRGFLPDDLLRVGKLRLVLVHRHNKVFDLDVKKALRTLKISGA